MIPTRSTMTIAIADCVALSIISSPRWIRAPCQTIQTRGYTNLSWSPYQGMCTGCLMRIVTMRDRGFAHHGCVSRAKLRGTSSLPLRLGSPWRRISPVRALGYRRADRRVDPRASFLFGDPGRRLLPRRLVFRVATSRLERFRVFFSFYSLFRRQSLSAPASVNLLLEDLSHFC